MKAPSTIGRTNGRWRTTALIVLVFGGLLGFSLLINVGRRQQARPTLAADITPTRVQSGEMFPEVQPAAISRIVVADKVGGRTVTLTHVPGDWQAVDNAGKIVPVDLPNVTRMIQILATLRYNRVLEETSVAAYGLTGDGKVRIDFDAGTTTYHLRIGGNTPEGSSTYVQRNDDPAIYLASNATLGILINALAVPTPIP